MPGGNPVEFIRDEGNQQGQRAFNRVVLEDVNGIAIWLGSLPVSTDYIDEPAVNTAAVITLPAQAGLSNVIDEIYWSYNGDPTAGQITIEDGVGTNVFSEYITSGGPGFFVFKRAKRGTVNTAMVITLTAGGALVTGTLNISAYTE